MISNSLKLLLIAMIVCPITAKGNNKVMQNYTVKGFCLTVSATITYVSLSLLKECMDPRYKHSDIYMHIYVTIPVALLIAYKISFTNSNIIFNLIKIKMRQPCRKLLKQ